MRRAIVYSFAVEAVASITLIATFKFASDLWGVIGFGAWTLARRIVAFGLPLMTLGVEVSLPRYIAYEGKECASGYLAGAALVIAVGSVGTTLLLFSAPDFFTHVLFGDSALRRFLVPLWGLLVAYSFHILCFAELRGRLRILEANLLHLWAFGAAPLVAFHWGVQTPERAMSANAVLVAVPPMLLLLAAFWRAGVDWAQASRLARTLVAYGSSRMASALALTALALLPPLMAAQEGGLARAGAVALGITMIGFAGTLMAPIALVSLPAAARQLGAGDISGLQRSYRLLTRLSPFILFSALAAAWLSAPTLAVMFLPSEATLASQTLRAAGIGAGSYAVFSLIRPLLDAVTEKPRVFHSTLVGAAAFGAVWIGGLALGERHHPLLPILGYSAAMLALCLSACVFAHAQMRSLSESRTRTTESGDLQ